MKNFSSTVVSEIKKLSILDVANRLSIVVKNNKGYCYNGHDRNSQSLTFSPSKGLYKCFGCGEGGDVIALVMKVCKLDFKSACSWLASNFKIESPIIFKSKPVKVIKPNVSSQKKIDIEYISNPEIYECLVNQIQLSSIAEKYLVNTRKFSIETINQLEIKDIPNVEPFFQKMLLKWGEESLIKCGLAKKDVHNKVKCVWWGHVIIFPFTNLNYQIDYLQARLIDSSKIKYINLAGVPPSIYNLNQLAVSVPNSDIYICEGIPDTISAKQFGLNSVGILGANSFKDSWTQYFDSFSISVIPDTDNGGKIFANNIRNSFKKVGKAIRIIELPPKYKDLNEYLNRKDN